MEESKYRVPIPAKEYCDLVQAKTELEVILRTAVKNNFNSYRLEETLKMFAEIHGLISEVDSDA